jgi:type III secretion system needle length determinant
MDALSDPYEWYRQQLVSQTSQQALNERQAAQTRHVSDYEAQQFQLMLQNRLSEIRQAKGGQPTNSSARSTGMSELSINPSLESKHEYFNEANQARLSEALKADPAAKALFEALARQQNPNDASVKQLIGQLQGYFGAETTKGGGSLTQSPELLLGELTSNKEGGTAMDKLKSNAALQDMSTYFAPGNENKLGALLSQNPEAKALFEQLVQQRQPSPEGVQQLIAQLKSSEMFVTPEVMNKLGQWAEQLSPQLRAFLSDLPPGQLAQIANLTPQEFSHLEKGGAEKLLAKLGITPETLNSLSALKGEDVARLSDLKEMIHRFSQTTATTTAQQGVAQGTIGDTILAALNTPANQEASLDGARTASTQARVAQIGDLVAERILVTNPELNQKQEVLIILKQDVLPGTQIKLSREGDVLHIAFQVRSEDTSNFIHQNLGQLRDLLHTKLGETVNIAVKTEQQQREENEGRSRDRRSVIDEMEEGDTLA